MKRTASARSSGGDLVRVMVQVRSTPGLAAASFGPISSAPAMSFAMMPGCEYDATFSPVPIPPKRPSSAPAGGAGMTAMFAASVSPTYVVRAGVRQETLAAFLKHAHADPGVVGVFADPRIQPIAVCPTGPHGTDRDVERLLLVDELRRRGLDGTGVRVVIVDTGINLAHLQAHGKTPEFDPELSWGPLGGQPLGAMPTGHGTMCAYDVCIAAPRCKLIDHAILTSQTAGGSAMDGLLSDAVQAYGILLSHMAKAPEPFAGDQLPRTLVVNNSWGMFHESWDFPVGHPENYSDNPDHPFNIIVASLDAAGADILFAAGNCGPECPDSRCEGATSAGIFGANSSAAATCVAGVITTKERIGYSTKGPGRLVSQKPDIASYTHFAGSGVFPADGGTSAATPVAAGVVAAIRRLYPSSVVSPSQLRDLLRSTAEPRGGTGFNHEYGHGVIDVAALLAGLESLTSGPPPAPPAPPTFRFATKRKVARKPARRK
jgi:subtilisin family serine protease